MLKTLSISNYVIIEQAELHFGQQLTMLTGETGAGKSIILGALGLVLGRRADTQVLLDPNQKGIVEAIFSHQENRLSGLLSRFEIDILDDVILRREIAPNGRSRAFINDTPVTLDVMTEVGAALIDVHEQFETLEIQYAQEQHAILDAWCNILKESQAYRKDFSMLTTLETKLAGLRQRQADALKEKDYLTFQLNEFETLPLEAGGIAAMEEEFQLQSGSEEIQASVGNMLGMLEGEQSFTDGLLTQVRTLAKLAQGNHRLSQFVQRIEELIELSHDLAHDLSHFHDELEPDPARRGQLEEKLDIINRVMLKHGAKDEEELNAVRVDLQQQLRAWENLDEQVTQCEKEVGTLRKSLKTQAARLSAKRRSEAPKLAKEVSSALHDLAMKNARLEIVIEDAAELNQFGLDEVEFRFAPNLGSEPKPIRKIASGGELSRLNLCLKSAVSDRIELPTLVFDEIDAGVSGEVAMRMGHKLRALAQKHQVIMITHSPQIAAQAGHHLQVEKSDINGRTLANVRMLPKQERITEIAKMLSGDPPTKAAIQNAKTLIEQ